MTRRVANHPSGKYLQENEAQTARREAAFRRAVERQAEKDRAAAEASRRKYGRNES